MDTQKLIEKIVKAINFAYKSDGTKPGLTISYINSSKGAKYYTSIVRWINGEKTVVVSHSEPTLQKALLELSIKFIDQSTPVSNPIYELAGYLIDKNYY